MVTSYKGPYSSKLGLPGLLYSVLLTLQQTTVNPCFQPAVQEAPGHSQASLAQSLMGSLLLSPGSWWTQGFICALQDFIKPHWPIKVKFSGGSQSLCQIPRLGNLLWALEVLQQCYDFSPMIFHV